MNNRNRILNIILIVIIFLSTFALSYLLLRNFPILAFSFVFSLFISILAGYIYFKATKDKVNSKFKAILLSLYAIIAFETLIFAIIVFMFSIFQSAMILFVVWIALGILGLYAGGKFYEYIKSSQLNKDIIESREKRANEYSSKIINSDYKKAYKYSIPILAILIIASLILNYFGMTFGLSLDRLVKLSIIIAVVFGLFFVNREAFKSYFSILLCLVLLGIGVAVLEKNSYFGLSPDIMRFVLMVGGSSLIVIGGLLYLKWKRGEF